MQPEVRRQDEITAMKLAVPGRPIVRRKSFSETTPQIRPCPSSTGAPLMPCPAMNAAASIASMP